MSSFHVTQTQKGLVSPLSTAVQVAGTRPHIQKRAAVVFLCLRSTLLCHTETAASGTARASPHCGARSLQPQFLPPSIWGSVRRSARLTRSAAQLATDFQLLQLSYYLLDHAALSLTTKPAVDGCHTYPLRVVGLKHPCVHWLWPKPCGARARTPSIRVT